MLSSVLLTQSIHLIIIVHQAVENSVLLWIAMISFSLFAVSEFVAALMANSESLLGDSITMVCCTHVCTDPWATLTVAAYSLRIYECVVAC